MSKGDILVGEDAAAAVRFVGDPDDDFVGDEDGVVVVVVRVDTRNERLGFVSEEFSGGKARSDVIFVSVLLIRD